MLRSLHPRRPEGLSGVLIYRWIVFLLAAGYTLRMFLLSDYDAFAGPFRFLTNWALLASFFAASRMLALTEGRSEKRWDGFVAMTTVINLMVVITYWRLFLADPASVTSDGALGAFYLELCLHALGPLLQWIDVTFIHRGYRKLKPAFMWLIGVISVYFLWMELVLQRFNTDPVGIVTSGLPYRFLNNLTLDDRITFYAVNFLAGCVLLLAFAGFARVIRWKALPPATPVAQTCSQDSVG